MNEYIFEAYDSGSFEPCRIDKFITEQMPDLSRSYIQKLIKAGNVSVNDKPVKSSYSVSSEDTIRFVLPDSVEPEILAEDIPLDILFEDDDLLIVNKPQGMVVHPAAGHYSGTLVNAIMFHCKGSLSGINGVMRPGIVHRIDKDTSGSLIICKNDFTHNHIAEQLKDHSANRVYHAVVYGELKEEQGVIQTNIGRDPKDRLRMAVLPTGSGKTAVTHYKLLKQLHGFSYIECRLETGRTHQIRVHMASIGHPLLGDPLYATNRKSQIKCDGQILHAKTIGFIHPRTEKYMEIDTELPDYFQRILTILESK